MEQYKLKRDTRDNVNNTSSYKNTKVIALYDDAHIVIVNPCDFQIGTVAKMLPE